MIPALDAELLPLLPDLVDRMRLGASVLELGCGRGRVLMELAARFPRSRFIGVDSSPAAIAEARAEARARELDNVEFSNGDDPTLRYDLILELGSANGASPCPGFAALALAPEGVYLQRHAACSGQATLDRGLALGPLIYARACVHHFGPMAAARDELEAYFAAVELHQLEYEPWDEYFICRARP